MNTEPRLIPPDKLRAWIDSSTGSTQRNSRKRWAYAYIYGTSFNTMAGWKQFRVRDLEAGNMPPVVGG